MCQTRLVVLNLWVITPKGQILRFLRGVLFINFFSVMYTIKYFQLCRMCGRALSAFIMLFHLTYNTMPYCDVIVPGSLTYIVDHGLTTSSH